jgi:hypothetical protein
VWIPLEKALFCENCETVSTSAGKRCGICGSERMGRLVPLIPEPWNPGPAAAVALAA